MDPETYASLPHDNRSGETIAAVVLCMVFATMAVSLRLYTRYFVLNKFWVDDILATVGLVGTISNGIIQCVHTRYGLGAHMWDLSEDESLKFWKIFYIMSITYNITLMLIKFTLFFQYYRLIQEVPHYRAFYLAVMALVTCWTVAQEFVLIFSCMPIPFFWDRSIPGECLDSDLIGWMNAVGNLVTDLIVLVLPIPVVWRLNLKRGRKWAVIGIFGLGFFTCAVSIARMVFFAKLTADISWDTVPVAAWGEAESASGLICSSLIALGPLIRRFSHRFRSDGRMSGSSSTPKKYSNLSSSRFSRRTTNRDKSLLRTGGSRKPADDDGSATELNCTDAERRPRKGAAEVLNDDRSTRSSKSLDIERDADAECPNAMPDLRLGLETGIRTIISSGNRDSVHSQSPVLPNGIVVKQVWSVRNKEPGEQD
ncbi:hypothetical protein GGR52DRAFT_581989 [Hypoxylon sp. FL1284]|nr:hypothetical protein GGR52DRAFT_581989 [Hypoxylon sp. FL1284]